MVSINEIYWLAGLLEGEGSFMFRKPSNRTSGYPTISIQTSDYDTIRKVQKIMNTSGIVSLKPRRIRGNVGNLPMYSTRCHKIKECIGWMMTLYSIMGLRRKVKIKAIIDQWKSASDGRRNSNR